MFSTGFHVILVLNLCGTNWMYYLVKIYITKRVQNGADVNVMNAK